MKIENEYCKPIAKTDDIEWSEVLKLRKQGIGGSDAGAIMGLSKYKSALTLYLEKTSAVEKKEETDRAKNGKRMEPLLLQGFADLYTEFKDIKIHVEKVPHLLQSKKTPFMLANIDGIAFRYLFNLTQKFIDGGVEIKTATYFMEDEWKDNSIPDIYYAQVQHYMYVTGLKLFFVPVLINSMFEYREVPRNDDFIKKMIKAEKWFWNCVETRTMPAPSGLDCENDYLLELYNNPGAEMITGDDKIFYQIEMYLEINEEIKKLEKDKEFLKQQFKTEIGNNKGIIAGDKENNHKIVWSRFERNYFMVEEFKKEHPDLYLQYCMTKPSSRLSVK